MDEQGASRPAVAGGVVAGLATFVLWILLTVAVAYGADAALGDTGSTVVVLVFVIMPAAAALLLLALPGTRVAGSGFVGGLAGGFLLGVTGVVLLFSAAGFSL